MHKLNLILVSSQLNVIFSDVGSPVTAVLGQLLPVSGNLDSNKQEVKQL